MLLKAGLAAAATFLFLLLPAGSYGQGNVSVGTNIPPMSRGPGISRNAAPTPRPTSEEPRLASALASFNNDAQAKGEDVEIWKAISSQTKVAVKTLRQQRTATKMDHGELLMANSLASSSGNSFDKIVARRAKAGSWSQLARELRIEPAALAARVTAANLLLKKARHTRGS